LASEKVGAGTRLALWLALFVLLGACAFLVTQQAVAGQDAWNPLRNAAPLARIAVIVILAFCGWLMGQRTYRALLRGHTKVKDAASAGVGFAIAVLMLGFCLAMLGVIDWQWLAAIVAVIAVIYLVMIGRSLGAVFVLLALFGGAAVAFVTWLLSR